MSEAQKKLLAQIKEMQREMNEIMLAMSDSEKLSLIYEMDDRHYELVGKLN